MFDTASNLNPITHETAQRIGVNGFPKAEIIYSNQFSGFLQGYNMPVNVIGFGTFHMKLFEFFICNYFTTFAALTDGRGDLQFLRLFSCHAYFCVSVVCCRITNHIFITDPGSKNIIPNKNYLKGGYLEHKVISYFRNLGYPFAKRMPASKGPADIVAIRWLNSAPEVVFIQCKAGKEIKKGRKELVEFVKNMEVYPFLRPIRIIK